MKQRRHPSNKLSATLAASILAVTLTGTTCGTFAWFMYATRSSIEEFEGVTIGFGDLEAGILSEVDLSETEIEPLGLVKDTSNPDETIYWFKGDFMSSDTINYVLEKNGYATDTLFPVTTRKYDKGDEFKLYETPRMVQEPDEQVEKLGRFYLPLVFRVSDVLEESGYIPGQNIYLSQMDIKPSDSSKHIHETIRIYTDDRDNHTHLIKPSSLNDGETAVGGILDMNKDGYYDSTIVDGYPSEYVYGQAEYTYSDSPSGDDPISYDRCTTFDANHREGVRVLETITPEVAKYEGRSDFKNKRTFVATTNPLTNNYAYLNLSIFAEGWDRQLTDFEKEVPFSMELKFEVVF